MPESRQLLPNVPVALVVRAKLPVGVTGFPGELSVTVTLHVDVWPKLTGEVQVIVVDVVLTLTLMLAVLPLPEC